MSEDMKVALNKAKAKYTIKDKFSGEVLGYAFMLTDGKVSLDQVELDPWHHHALDPGPEPEYIPPAKIPGSLESDLDISEDSSVNSTADEILSIPDCNANKDVSENVEILKNVDSSTITREANDDMKTRQVAASSSIQSVTQTIASQIAAQLAAGEIHKSFSRIEPGREKGEVSQDQICSERIAPTTRFVPGHGRYGAFYTDEGVAQPNVKKYKNHKLVRCLLCKEEKILALSNFGGHCQTVHEPPVQCSVCGLEFTSARIRTHKQICRRRLLGKLEESPISRHKKFDKVENKVDYKKCENKVEKCDGESVMFTFTSAVNKEACVKVALKKGKKVKKAMKKFANRFNVTKEMLIFEVCGVKLTGKELVDELDGKEIVVHGELK